MVDMEPRNDIESLLQTGYFTTSRSKSPKPYEPSAPTTRAEPPLTQYRPSPPPHAPSIPREPPRRTERFVPRYVPRPPAPTVEDEAEALSKEHGSSDAVSIDAPPSRGDVDQQVLLEEVHEHNPERRFVIIPNSTESTASAPTAPSKKASADKETPAEPRARGGKDYEANTARKYGPASADEPLAEPRVPLERRKSRQDLPRIETEFEMQEPKTKNHHRSKSTTFVDQPPEYFTPQTKKRVSATKEDLLSPQVIKHSTGGRDKVYYDYSRGQGRPLAPQRSRSNLVGDRRSDETYGRPTQSMSPGATRRATMNADAPKPTMKAPDDQPSESSRRRDEYRDESSSHYERRRERRNSTYRRDSPPPKQRDGSSSSSDYSTKVPSSNTRRRRSTVIHDDRPFLQTPIQERTKPLNGRSRSRAPTSPIPSPKISNKSFEDSLQPQGPRSSTTFPTPRSSRESTLPYPEDDILPRKDILGPREEERSVPRSRSRAPPSLTASATLPAMMPFMPPELSNPIDIIRSPQPGTPEARASTSQPDLRPEQSWPPAPFDPFSNTLTVDRPVGAYRRYSEDTGRGGATQIPDCPRTKGVAGKTDWLSLPRCDNFNICPDCYTGVFSNSSFRNEFVPMPFRSVDKPISCDFGSSPWYRIAWLLTVKSHQSDLRLFHQIAKIAQSQPCPGDRIVARAWYSIQNPSREGTLPDFAVCYECAKTVEVLLPSLTGIFVPTHATANPTRNCCSMRYHPDRKRFVLYFDAMETTCDKALATTSAPNIPSLAKTIDRISMFAECREDRPVAEENWHVMQYLPELTVCGDCFDDVVRPRLLQDGQVARNFYMRPQRLSMATCQLYSDRMREVFKKACRRNDVKYLEGKVLERQKIEAGIHAELARLDKRRGQDEWTEKEMEKLISTWKKWE